MLTACSSTTSSVPRPRSSWSSSAAASSARAAPLRRPAASSVSGMSGLETGARLDRVQDGSSPVLSGSTRADRIELEKAYGLAHRGFEIPNEVDTRFAIASGTRSLTALAVVCLIEDGLLELSTAARSVLGQDLPLIDDGVTIEHLLSHRSGICDYLDEEAGLDAQRVSDACLRARACDDRGLPRRCWTGTRRSLLPGSASRTATAAASCWR